MTDDPMSSPDDRRDNDDAPSVARRPIPDGGLGTAMPDWMRQSPSWKRDPEPRPVRTIPAPDVSVIDPQDLIDIDDLPQWLQAVASRPGSRAAVARPAEGLHSIVEQPLPTAPATDDVAAGPAPTFAERSRTGPGSWLPMLATGTPAQRPDHVRLTPSPLDAVPPWWMSDAVVAALFVAIVLTLIFVILTAIGVL